MTVLSIVLQSSEEEMMSLSPWTTEPEDSGTIQPEQNTNSTVQTHELLYMYREAPSSHIWHSLGACVKQTG